MNNETAMMSTFPLNSDFNFSSGTLWDRLGGFIGGSQRVPKGPRGTQRDPEEELRSVFNGKVARNNGN